MMKRKKLFRYYLRYVQFIGWTALLFACSDDSPEQKPGRNDGNGSYHDTDPGER